MSLWDKLANFFGFSSPPSPRATTWATPTYQPPRPAYRHSATAAPPRRVSGFGGSTYTLVNPEGEMQEINTGDPSGGFYGPGWDRFCRAFQNKELLLGRVVDEAVGRQRNEFNQSVEGGEQWRAGFLIEFADVDLGSDSRERPWRGFLPMRAASDFTDLDHQLGRYAWVNIRQFDKNNMKIVLHEVPQAQPIWDVGSANTFLHALEGLLAKADANEEVRGSVVRVAVDRKRGGIAGLVVNCEGHAAFMPASQSMGLCDLGEQDLLGLPVCGFLEPDVEQHRLILSLKRMYREGVGGSMPPRRGAIATGISLAVVGGWWYWLLPRGRRGVADPGVVGLTPARAKDMCGWTAKLKVHGDHADRSDGERPMLDVEPLFE